MVVDVSLAINKNPEWEKKLGISREDLEDFDERETHIGLGDFILKDFSGDISYRTPILF